MCPDDDGDAGEGFTLPTDAALAYALSLLCLAIQGK